MNAILVRSERFLDRPLGGGVRVALFLCTLLLLPTRGYPLGTAQWLPFALGALALLYLRVCVQGKVRDLVDVAVLTLYFVLFVLLSDAPRVDLSRLMTAAALAIAALVLLGFQASADDAAELRSAG
jgi:hypothetical protein